MGIVGMDDLDGLWGGERHGITTTRSEGRRVAASA
jgi:hypothetical protein